MSPSAWVPAPKPPILSERLSAHFLASGYIGVVFAVGDIAHLAACNAADIVAHQAVAHRAVVYTVMYIALTAAGNTAHISDGIDRLGAHDGVQRKLCERDRILLGRDIYLAVACAAADNAQIVTCHAACKMAAAEAAVEAAVLNYAAYKVFSGDAAYLVGTADLGLNDAVGYKAGVAAGQCAHRAAAAAGDNIALESEISDLSAGCDITEEALI